MDLEFKTVPVGGVKVVDEAQGIVEAIVSVTGVVDEVKDIIEPGAYQKTLATRTPKGVWSHAWDKPVSKTLEAVELLPGDDRLPKKTRGGRPWPREAGALMIKTQFNLETQRGRDAYADVKFFGDDAEWSVGYQVPATGAVIEQKSGRRRINTMDLYEYSPVLFGAMPMAVTTSVKQAQLAYKALLAADLEAKGNAPPTKHPYVDKNGDGKCDICNDTKDEHNKTMGKKDLFEDLGEPELYEPIELDEKTAREVLDAMEMKKQFTSEDRAKLSEAGAALPDGSYPIRNAEDLKNAIQAFGRAKDKDKAKRHIMKRARALGLEDSLPDDWKATTKALAATFDAEDLDALEDEVKAADCLVEYWATGDGARRVRWGVPGDFKRCVRMLHKYLPEPGVAEGVGAYVHALTVEKKDLEDVVVFDVETKALDVVAGVEATLGHSLTEHQAKRLTLAVEEVKAVLGELSHVEGDEDEDEDDALTDDELMLASALRLHAD